MTHHTHRKHERPHTRLGDACSRQWPPHPVHTPHAPDLAEYVVHVRDVVCVVGVPELRDDCTGRLHRAAVPRDGARDQVQRHAGTAHRAPSLALQRGRLEPAAEQTTCVRIMQHQQDTASQPELGGGVAHHWTRHFSWKRWSQPSSTVPARLLGISARQIAQMSAFCFFSIFFSVSDPAFFFFCANVGGSPSAIRVESSAAPVSGSSDADGGTSTVTGVITTLIGRPMCRAMWFCGAQGR